MQWFETFFQKNAMVCVCDFETRGFHVTAEHLRQVLPGKSRKNAYYLRMAQYMPYRKKAVRATAVIFNNVMGQVVNPIGVAKRLQDICESVFADIYLPTVCAKNGLCRTTRQVWGHFSLEKVQNGALQELSDAARAVYNSFGIKTAFWLFREVDGSLSFSAHIYDATGDITRLFSQKLPYAGICEVLAGHTDTATANQLQL